MPHPPQATRPATTGWKRLSESLDFTTLTRHGFTREYGAALRREVGVDEQLEAIRRRVADMSEAVELKSSVTSARAANVLQAAVLAISALALLATLFTILVTRT
jgi:hypothetical protein